MTVSELKAALKGHKLNRCFLFCGQEDYLKRYYLSEFRKLLVPDETLAVFNHLRFEGEQMDFTALRSALETPPMMADDKLIEWHLPALDKMKDADADRFCSFAASLSDFPYACVVIFADGDAFDTGTLPNRPSKLYKQFDAVMAVVAFQTQTDADLRAWMERHFRHENITPAPEALRALLSRAGTSMDILSGEIDKLICYAHARNRNGVTAEDVESVSAVTTGDDAFGLANALLAGQAAEAYRQLRDLRRRRVKPLLVLASVSATYAGMVTVCELRDAGMSAADIAAKTRMHAYKLSLMLRALTGRRPDEIRRMLYACRALDLSAKGGADADVFVGLERLIAEMSVPHP